MSLISWFGRKILGRPGVHVRPSIDSAEVFRGEASKLFSGLQARLNRRYSKQPKCPDLLPDQTVNLKSLTQRFLPKTEAGPEGKRSNMRTQLALLKRSFAGRSELELLHGLAISYLRRDTPHTQKALHIFRRIWSEQADFMVSNMSARWLISALQTFYDHGESCEEKAAGGMGFIYGNMIKVYETEHNATKSEIPPRLSDYRNRSVPKMFGFKPGDDILININVVTFHAAISGGLAGPPLLKLLETVAGGQTIFQRSDALRDNEEFSGHPSFTRSFEGR